MDGVTVRRLKAALDDATREHIIASLAALDGNRTRTARELGVSLRFLRERIALYKQQGHAVPESRFKDGFKEYQQRRRIEDEARQERIRAYYIANPTHRV